MKRRILGYRTPPCHRRPVTAHTRRRGGGGAHAPGSLSMQRQSWAQHTAHHAAGAREHLLQGPQLGLRAQQPGPCAGGLVDGFALGLNGRRCTCAAARPQAPERSFRSTARGAPTVHATGLHGPSVTTAKPPVGLRVHMAFLCTNLCLWGCRAGVLQGYPQGEKRKTGLCNANRNELSRGRSLLHGHGTFSTSTVGCWWRLAAVRGWWWLAVGGGWQQLAVGGLWPLGAVLKGYP